MEREKRKEREKEKDRFRERRTKRVCVLPGLGGRNSG